MQGSLTLLARRLASGSVTLHRGSYQRRYRHKTHCFTSRMHEVGHHAKATLLPDQILLHGIDVLAVFSHQDTLKGLEDERWASLLERRCLRGF
jgi:hypothetical protein